MCPIMFSMGDFGKYFLTVQHDRPSVSRWVLGTVFIVFVWLVLGSILTFFLLPLDSLLSLGEGDVGEDASSADLLNQMLSGIPSWLGLLVLLFSFVPLFLAVLVAYPLFLKQSWRKVFVVYGRWSWGRTFYGAALWGGLILLIIVPSLLLGWRDFEYVFNWSTFWPFLLVAVFFLPVQTTAEEMFFRGWLTQWLASRLSNRWVVSTISAVLFVLLHLTNPEVGVDFIGSVLAWFMIGFVFTWVSLRDGSIELAVGAHFVNNFVSAVVFPYEGSAIPVEGVFLLSSDGFSVSTFALLAAAVLFVVLSKPKHVGKDDVSVVRFFGEDDDVCVGSVVIFEDKVKVFTVEGADAGWVDVLQKDGFFDGFGFEDRLAVLLGGVAGLRWETVLYDGFVDAVNGEKMFVASNGV